MSPPVWALDTIRGGEQSILGISWIFRKPVVISRTDDLSTTRSYGTQMEIQPTSRIIIFKISPMKLGGSEIFSPNRDLAFNHFLSFCSMTSSAGYPDLTESSLLAFTPRPILSTSPCPRPSLELLRSEAPPMTGSATSTVLGLSSTWALWKGRKRRIVQL